MSHTPLEVTPEFVPPHPLTEAGDAEYFAERFGGDDALLQFDHRLDCWLIFEQHRWKRDASKQAVEFALMSMRQRQQDALAIVDGDSSALRHGDSFGDNAPRSCRSALRVVRVSSCGATAGGRNRTHTGSEPHGILSPARLPVSPLRPRVGTFSITASL